MEITEADAADKTPTRMQKRFILAYVNDPFRNAAQAAIAAGCNPENAKVQASNWLRMKHITDEIEYRLDRRRTTLCVTTEWVIRKMVKVYRRCMQEIPVLDAEGNPTGVYRFDARHAILALSKIGDYTGGFEDKKVKETAAQTQVNFITVRDAVPVLNQADKALEEMGMQVIIKSKETEQSLTVADFMKQAESAADFEPDDLFPDPQEKD